MLQTMKRTTTALLLAVVCAATISADPSRDPSSATMISRSIPTGKGAASTRRRSVPMNSSSL